MYEIVHEYDKLESVFIYKANDDLDIQMRQ